MKTNTELTTVEQSNDLRHTISINDATANIHIKIRLNDECKNGHQDFSITANVYEIGKVRSDRNMIAGGCCHDDILAVRPDLQIFVNLHLCDYTGAPMYAVENGFYHLKNGFNNTKPNAPEFKSEFCQYYRITPAQFDALVLSENKLQYAIKLEKLGIINQWKMEADKAIALMENFTGKKFLVDSVRTQYDAPSEDIIKAEEQLEAIGYYTPEKIQERTEKAKADKTAKEIAEIRAELAKKIKTETDEANLKIMILEAGLPIDNFIYYTHTNKAVFNWMESSYRTNITQEQFDAFIASVDYSKLPSNITFSLGK